RHFYLLCIELTNEQLLCHTMCARHGEAAKHRFDAAIGEHCIANIVIGQLPEPLVGKGEEQPEFTNLIEHLRDVERDKILEFVQEQEVGRWPPSLARWCSSKRAFEKLVNEEGTKSSGVVVREVIALRELH